MKQVGFKLGVKGEGVMGEQSDESIEEKVTDEGTDESEMQELIPE